MRGRDQPSRLPKPAVPNAARRSNDVPHVNERVSVGAFAAREPPRHELDHERAAVVGRLRIGLG